MSKRKAFWGQSGAIRRPCPRAVNGKLLEAVIGDQGVAFFAQGTGAFLGGLDWAEMYRLSQRGPLEQLGAAVAERSDPRCVVKLCDEPAITGRCLCANHAKYADEVSEPRILPADEEPISLKDPSRFYCSDKECGKLAFWNGVAWVHGDGSYLCNSAWVVAGNIRVEGQKL